MAFFAMAVVASTRPAICSGRICAQCTCLYQQNRGKGLSLTKEEGETANSPVLLTDSRAAAMEWLRLL